MRVLSLFRSIVTSTGEPDPQTAPPAVDEPSHESEPDLGRYSFVGAHLTRETKDALRREAARTKKSMSRLVAEAVREKLRSVGYAV